MINHERLAWLLKTEIQKEVEDADITEFAKRVRSTEYMAYA